MANFYSIPLEEMDAFLRSRRFQPVDLTYRNRPVKEWVYERPLPRQPNHFVRVYTGINRYGRSQNQSRGAGKDAIRVQVIYKVGDVETLVTQPKRVHRVTGWADNLDNRLSEIAQSLPQVVFDRRGEPMTLRRKNGKYFWGSRDYPRYKETRPFQAESAPLVGQTTEAPYEIKVYVPSTLLDQPISDSDFKSRIEETQEKLSELFGGFTTVGASGGYLSQQDGVISEPVIVVSSWATEEDYQSKLADLENFLKQKKTDWGQEVIGFEFENDFFMYPAFAAEDEIPIIDLNSKKEIEEYGLFRPYEPNPPRKEELRRESLTDAPENNNLFRINCDGVYAVRTIYGPSKIIFGRNMLASNKVSFNRSAQRHLSGVWGLMGLPRNNSGVVSAFGPLENIEKMPQFSEKPVIHLVNKKELTPNRIVINMKGLVFAYDIVNREVEFYGGVPESSIVSQDIPPEVVKPEMAKPWNTRENARDYKSLNYLWNRKNRLVRQGLKGEIDVPDEEYASYWNQFASESDNQVIRFNGEMSEYADKNTDDSFTSMSNLAHISLPDYEESYYWTSADGNSRATVAYDEENGVILIPNFEVSLHMRGKKMAHKYLEELIDDAYLDGYSVQVIDVDNHAIGFWEKMQSQGLIEGWSKGSFAAEEIRCCKECDKTTGLTTIQTGTYCYDCLPINLGAESGNPVIRFDTLEEFHNYVKEHPYYDVEDAKRRALMRAESREEFQQFSQTQPVIILDFECYAWRGLKADAIGVAYNHVVPLSNVSFQNLGGNLLPRDLIKEYGEPQSAAFIFNQDYQERNSSYQNMKINLKGIPFSINWSWSYPEQLELWLWKIPLNSIENKDELNFKDIVKLNPIKGQMWNHHQRRREMFASEDNYEATYGVEQAKIRRRLKNKIKKQAIMGTKAGQWSARKSQELKRQYEAACEKKGLNAYKGKKTKSQDNLSKWSQQKWRTASGKKSSTTGEPYFPAKAVAALKDKGLYSKAKQQKKAATKAGKQNTRYSDDIRAVVKNYRSETYEEATGVEFSEQNPEKIEADAPPDWRESIITIPQSDSFGYALYRKMSDLTYNQVWRVLELIDDLNRMSHHHAVTRFSSNYVEIWIYSHDSGLVEPKDYHWAEDFNDMIATVDWQMWESETEWEDVDWEKEKPVKDQNDWGEDVEWEAEDDWGSLRPETRPDFPTVDAQIASMLRNHSKVNVNGEQGCPRCGQEDLFYRESTGTGTKWYCYGCFYTEKTESQKSQKIVTLEKYGLKVRCPDCNEMIVAYNQASINSHRKKCGVSK